MFISRRESPPCVQDVVVVLIILRLAVARCIDGVFVRVVERVMNLMSPIHPVDFTTCSVAYANSALVRFALGSQMCLNATFCAKTHAARARWRYIWKLCVRISVLHQSMPLTS